MWHRQPCRPAGTSGRIVLICTLPLPTAEGPADMQNEPMARWRVGVADHGERSPGSCSSPMGCQAPGSAASDAAETRRRAGPARDDRRAAGDPCGAGRGVGRRCGQRGPSGPRPRRQGSRQPRLLDRGVSRPGRGAVRERAAGPEPAASRPSGTDPPAGPGRRWLPASAASVSIVRVSDSLRACGPARY